MIKRVVRLGNNLLKFDQLGEFETEQTIDCVTSLKRNLIKSQTNN